MIKRVLHHAYVIAAVGLSCASLSAFAVLPDAVAAALKSAGIPASHVALWMAPANGGAPTLQHNVAEPFNPASVMKLVTSSAALEILGPGYTWSTDAFIQGELRDGVLNGNLILRGGGDPALTWDRFGNFLVRFEDGIFLDGGQLPLIDHHHPGVSPFNGLKCQKSFNLQTSYSSTMKGCVISAPMTGSGKTTVTLGLLAALRNRGAPLCIPQPIARRRHRRHPS